MPELELVVIAALVVAIGVGAQWLAWGTRLPAIVLLSAAGLIAGPGLDIIRPQEQFGELVAPIVSLAVAVILFEGGLNLNFRELRGTATAVRRMVLLGGPIGWLLSSAAAHYLVGLTWPVSIVFGGLLVVTGPTVIMPLLRQAKLSQRVSSLLKWEGIVNDPIGALFAVFAFEFVALRHEGEKIWTEVAGFLAFTVAVSVISVAIGRGVAWIFERGHAPEYLKAPLILATVVAVYVGADLVQDESGLIAVTVLGVTLANTRIASIEELRRFKEYMSVLLVSIVFVILTATLTVDDIRLLDPAAIAFIAVLLFVIRPISVLLSTAFTGLEWSERALVAWIAPRGVVLVAVSGFFAPLLSEAGYADADKLVPLAFIVVFATVIAHGFTIGPLGRRLGLSATTRGGVLFVGGSPWTTALAEQLHKRDIPVLVADSNWHHLRAARQAGIPILYGEILSEVAEHSLDLGQFRFLIAATDNFAYNALVCSRFAHDIGRDRIFQLASGDHDEDDPRAVGHTMRGQTLMADDVGYDGLMRRAFAGWEFGAVTLTEEYGREDFENDNPEALPVLFIREERRLTFKTETGDFEPGEGDTLIAYRPVTEGGREREETPTPPQHPARRASA